MRTRILGISCMVLIPVLFLGCSIIWLFGMFLIRIHVQYIAKPNYLLIASVICLIFVLF